MTCFPEVSHWYDARLCHSALCCNRITTTGNWDQNSHIYLREVIFTSGLHQKNHIFLSIVTFSSALPQSSYLPHIYSYLPQNIHIYLMFTSEYSYLPHIYLRKIIFCSAQLHFHQHYLRIVICTSYLFLFTSDLAQNSHIYLRFTSEVIFTSDLPQNSHVYLRKIIFTYRFL